MFQKTHRMTFWSCVFSLPYASTKTKIIYRLDLHKVAQLNREATCDRHNREELSSAHAQRCLDIEIQIVYLLTISVAQKTKNKNKQKTKQQNEPGEGAKIDLVVYGAFGQSGLTGRTRVGAVAGLSRLDLCGAGGKNNGETFGKVLQREQLMSSSSSSGQCPF